MPRLPFARSVTATTTITPPMRPWVMKFFGPVDPPASAVAHGRGLHAGRVAARSGLGQSPRAEHLAAHQRGRYFAFCASVPNIAMWEEHSPLCAATESAIAGHTRASSSMQMQ